MYIVLVHDKLLLHHIVTSQLFHGVTHDNYFMILPPGAEIVDRIGIRYSFLKLRKECKKEIIKRKTCV